MAVDVEKLIETFAGIRRSSTFLWLNGYRNQQGEVANHGLVFHISYETILTRSLEIVEAIVVTNDLEKQAKIEVMQSLKTSLDRVKGEPIEERIDAYVHPLDADGQFVKGVKMHRETGELHLYGYSIKKKIVSPGVYKPVKSKALTIEKKKLMDQTPASKWRQFIMMPDKFETLHVEGLEIGSDPHLATFLVK